jgi:hypothetical protein
MLNRPPPAIVPALTSKLILPPAPKIEEPVRSVIIPLLPLLELPEVKDREPDTPSFPAAVVLMLNAPLDAARPYPVIIETAPPVDEVLSPAFKAILPPCAIDPSPTTMLMLPPAPR